MNYHLARDGAQLGIYSEDEVSLKLQSGELRESDLCWTEGMADWLPLKEIHLPSSDAVNPYAPPAADVSKLPQPAEAALATLGQRLAAAMLDTLMAIVCVVPIGFGMAATSSDTGTLGSIMTIVGGLALLALTVYNLVLLTQKGQTLGKKWLAIRIVNVGDQSNPGFVKAVLLRSIVNGIIGSVPVLGPFYALADIGFIFRGDRRCIHDLIAGTEVVQEAQPS